MLTTNDDLSYVFDHLISAVQDLERGRGQCLGAALKLELRRRTAGSFSEYALGFPRFGDFLKAAEAAGHIQLQRTPGGDVRVSLKSHQESSEAPSASGDAGTLPGIRTLIPNVRVRQDLWNAFNSIHEEWIYDSSKDLAIRKSAAHVGAGSASELVSVPNGRDMLMNSIRAFAETQSDEAKQKTLHTIEQEGAPLNFLVHVKMDRVLQRLWHRFHVQKVVSAIQSWATSNSLQPRNVILQWPSIPKFQPVNSWAATKQTSQKIEPVPSQPGLQPGARTVLTERLSSVVDELIDKLIELRGLISILKH